LCGTAKGFADGVEETAAPVASLALGTVRGLKSDAGHDILRLRFLGAQQMPGFAIALPAGAFAYDVGIKAEAFAGRESVDRQHVPGIFRDDVGDQNVDLVGGVNDFALAVDGVGGLNIVAAGADDFGAFELHAPEAGSSIEDEIAALAVAPGTGDVEAETFGL